MSVKGKVFVILISFFLFLAAFTVIFSVQASGDTSVVIYGNMGCKPCLDYKNELLNALEELNIMDVEVRDLESDLEARIGLNELNTRFNIPPSMQGSIVVVIDDRFVFEGRVPVDIVIDFLAGHKGDYQFFVVYRDELRNLYMLMDERGEIRECNIIHSISECLPKTMSGLMSLPLLPLILVGGVVDGVNPCAFAVLLFFLAFLFTVSKASPLRVVKRRVLKVGSVYIAAVYVTYLLIGVGLLAAISFSPFPNLIAVIGGLLVIVLGVVSVKDFFFPGRGFSLKIPSRQWRTIARWVHKASIPSTCVVGFLVALFEFPCTGGVYVAILGMLAVKTSRMIGVLYLLVYNVAFILPLIVLLVFASNRRVVERLRGWQKEKAEYLRLLLGLFMMALGVWILFYIHRYSPLS